MARPRKTVSTTDLIVKAAADLRKAQADQTAALTKLGVLFRQGRDQKLAVVAMTKESGLSRSTVYRLLGEDAPQAAA